MKSEPTASATAFAIMLEALTDIDMRKPMTASPQNEATNQEPTERERLITAYCVNPTLPMPIIPASQSRKWMDESNGRFAYRCLPLLMANQSGWFLLNSQRLCITWNGGRSADNLRIEALDDGPPKLASSHFGHGIVTWDVPYLFRTSPGYDLLVRGPSNWPKDGIYPLDGVVETDWLGSTFSINWKMTRINHEVIFEAGEPLAMIAPQSRTELEAFRGEIRDIESDAAVLTDYRRWEDQRNEFIRRLREKDPEAQKQGWEKHYFRGVKVNGEQAEAHRTRVTLQEFGDSRKRIG
jgi:Family of unknown function (DUF6065)